MLILTRLLLCVVEKVLHRPVCHHPRRSACSDHRSFHRTVVIATVSAPSAAAVVFRRCHGDSQTPLTPIRCRFVVQRSVQ